MVRRSLAGLGHGDGNCPRNRGSGNVSGCRARGRRTRLTRLRPGSPFTGKLKASSERDCEDYEEVLGDEPDVSLSDL